MELAAGAYGGSRGYGYSFFYLDERKADGTEKGEGVDGKAHGEFIASLVERENDNVPWHATFVAGEGYVEFPREKKV